METFSNENLVQHGLNKFYIIGLARMGKNRKNLVNAHSRSHVFRCVLLNLHNKVDYDVKMWAMEDIQFNMDTHNLSEEDKDKGVIVNYHRIIPLKMTMNGGVTTSAGNSLKMTMNVGVTTSTGKRKEPITESNREKSPVASTSKKLRESSPEPPKENSPSTLFSAVRRVLVKNKAKVIEENKTSKTKKSVLDEIKSILGQFKKVKLWTQIDKVLQSKKSIDCKFAELTKIIFYDYSDHDNDSLSSAAAMVQEEMENVIPSKRTEQKFITNYFTKDT